MILDRWQRRVLAVGMILIAMNALVPPRRVAEGLENPPGEANSFRTSSQRRANAI
jgi:hypothetical protein